MANDEAFRFVPRDPSSRFRGTNKRSNEREEINGYQIYKKRTFNRTLSTLGIGRKQRRMKASKADAQLNAQPK